MANITFLQSNSSTSDLTTYTFASENLGTASADRVIIVGMACRDTGTNVKTFDSVTIGGVSATIHVQRQNNSVNSTVVAIASAAVPTGTTGDIVITMSEAVLRMAIGVYSATGLDDHTTPSDTDSSIADDPTVNLDIPAGGICVGIGAKFATGDTDTWTGLTEDFGITVENTRITAASDLFESAQTGLTITIDFSTTNESAGVFASWAAAAADTTTVVNIQSLGNIQSITNLQTLTS